MADMKHTGEMTGLSEFVGAWEAFQQTQSKLDGLRLLLILEYFVSNVANGFYEMQQQQSSGVLAADDLTPIYIELFKRVDLSSELLNESNIARVLEFAQTAGESGLTRIENCSFQVCQALTALSQQMEEADRQSAAPRLTTSQQVEETECKLTDSELTTLFNRLFDTSIPQFSLDEHIDTHVLRELEQLHEKISEAKRCLDKLERHKPAVLPKRISQFDELLEKESEQSGYAAIADKVKNYPENCRELIQGVLGTLHSTQLFSIAELQKLLELPISKDEQKPRQEHFEALLKKAVTNNKLTDKEVQLLKSQFDYFNQIITQLSLLNPCTLPGLIQEQKIILQMYKEAILEDFQKLDRNVLKNFEDIKSGRTRLLRHLFEHLRETFGGSADPEVFLTSIQRANSFAHLLADSDFRPENDREPNKEDIAKEDIAYAELLFNLQAGSFDVCQKFNAAVKNSNETNWTKLRDSAIAVNNTIDKNRETLSTKTDFFSFLKQAYLKILSFFGLDGKRTKYIVDYYKKEMVPVSCQKIEEIITEIKSKQDTDDMIEESSADDEKQDTVNETPVNDTTTSATTVSSSLSADMLATTRRKTLLQRTNTLLLKSAEQTELADMYQKVEVETQEAQQQDGSELPPGLILIAVVNKNGPHVSRPPSFIPIFNKAHQAPREKQAPVGRSALPGFSLLAKISEPESASTEPVTGAQQPSLDTRPVTCSS